MRLTKVMRHLSWVGLISACAACSLDNFLRRLIDQLVIKGLEANTNALILHFTAPEKAGMPRRGPRKKRVRSVRMPYRGCQHRIWLYFRVSAP